MSARPGDGPVGVLPDLPPGSLRRLARRALAEDVGRGDWTTALVVPHGRTARALIVSRGPGVVAGLDVCAAVFEGAGRNVAFEALAGDGTRVAAGTLVARIEGPAAALLGAERTALNFLQRLSGIATLTARAVAAVAGTACRITDTRKTTPGLRLLEKRAVHAGGGLAHRLGLDDGILIKDNHLVLAGPAAAAVRRARAGAPAGLRVEVEIDRLDDLEAVIEAGAEVVLLDNMGIDEVAEAVRRAAGRVVLEASGGIGLEQLAAFAATGVDRIALGCLTHSAPALDLSLEVEVVGLPVSR